MTIVVVCDVLGAANNGTTVAALNLINTMREKGHTVKVICPDKDRLGQEGYYVTPVYNLLFLNNYVRKNGVVLARADLQLIGQALEGADVVHVICPFSLGHAAAKMAHKRGIPVTAGFHCQAENFTNHIFMMNFLLANHLAYKAFNRLLYKYCVAIHYPSHFICDTFEGEVGSTNHYVISNGVGERFVRTNAEKPGEFSDKFVILFTGRYSKEKSHRVLIDAVSRSAHRDSIQLIFAGDGPQREKIVAYSKKKLSVQPVFKFFHRDEMLEVINYSDLYVHPAEIEIEAISCLEAISCGKVPVISNSGRSATRYFALTERNLFKCNDSSDLAAKIDFWIEHEDERRKCSEQYLGYAEQFNFTKCMDAMEKMLLDAVKKNA